jgi:peptidoglycan/xylan/chitin deacetylase (PgdA/CDA1 family)
VKFQWEVVTSLLGQRSEDAFPFIHFWPDGHRFALVLTHDVETAEGQEHVRRVADEEEDLGFRSSFNIVPELYRVDHALLGELRSRGFEIGIHGLKHDGKLFRSRRGFTERARAINRHLQELGAVGYRSPLTHRQPEWMQALDIGYDSSFFDTDPYEPIGGGAMSIWPFFLGRFVELPYTLAQDSTLVGLLKEKTPRMWLEKVRFVEEFCGMALVNTHPDYLRSKTTAAVYREFLEVLKDRGGYWRALPREVAWWWRGRAAAEGVEVLSRGALGTLRLREGKAVVELQQSKGVCHAGLSGGR